jgi:chromosomal replication initiation ATPase DnaA
MSDKPLRYYKPVDPERVAKLRRHLPEVFGVRWEDVAGKGRTQPVAEARHVAMTLLSGSQDAIAEVFGRDGSVVLYAREQCRNHREVDRKFRALCEELERRLAQP